MSKYKVNVLILWNFVEAKKKKKIDILKSELSGDKQKTTKLWGNCLSIIHLLLP